MGAGTTGPNGNASAPDTVLGTRLAGLLVVAVGRGGRRPAAEAARLLGSAGGGAQAGGADAALVAVRSRGC